MILSTVPMFKSAMFLLFLLLFVGTSGIKLNKEKAFSWWPTKTMKWSNSDSCFLSMFRVCNLSNTSCAFSWKPLGILIVLMTTCTLKDSTPKCQYWPTLYIHPWKMKMESKNHPIENEHHLPNLHFLAQNLSFPGRIVPKTLPQLNSLCPKPPPTKNSWPRMLLPLKWLVRAACRTPPRDGRWGSQGNRFS